MLTIINLSTGIAIIILALLIRIFNLSTLIAGYNTAPKKEKKKYNEKLLIKYTSNSLIIAGLILIAGIIPALLNLKTQTLFFTISWIIFTIFILGMILFMNLNKKIKK